jgi:hypothetical protein
MHVLVRLFMYVCAYDLPTQSFEVDRASAILDDNLLLNIADPWKQSITTHSEKLFKDIAGYYFEVQ